MPGCFTNYKMIAFWRKLVFLGTIIFASTFFLPRSFYNSPFGRFLWSFDAASLTGTLGESLAFIGICLAIVYPYMWAVITAVFFITGVHSRWAIRSQFICQLFGAIPIVSLGLALILLKAEFPSSSVQWTAVLAPVLLLLLLLAIGVLVKSTRRLPTLVAITILIFTCLQFLLYYYVQLDGGAGWGYLVGGLGGLVGLIGSCGLIISAPNDRAGG